jgi:hypothetical protein
MIMKTEPIVSMKLPPWRIRFPSLILKFYVGLIDQTQPDPLVPEDSPSIFDFDSLPTPNGYSNQSTTSLKSIGDIKAKHGLTNEEINNLGWVIIEKLPKFLHMLEEILNSEDTRSHAAMVLAKIVQSEASRLPTQPFFFDYFDDNIAPQQMQPPYLYGWFLFGRK